MSGYMASKMAERQANSMLSPLLDSDDESSTGSDGGSDADSDASSRMETVKKSPMQKLKELVGEIRSFCGLDVLQVGVEAHVESILCR